MAGPARLPRDFLDARRAAFSGSYQMEPGDFFPIPAPTKRDKLLDMYVPVAVVEAVQQAAVAKRRAQLLRLLAELNHFEDEEGDRLARITAAVERYGVDKQPTVLFHLLGYTINDRYLVRDNFAMTLHDMIASVIRIEDGQRVIAASAILAPRKELYGDNLILLREQTERLNKFTLEVVKPAAETGPLAAFVIAGMTLQELRPHVDEVLATAGKYWSNMANDFADNDQVLIATLLQTFNDLFIPKNSIEAAFMLLPIGKVALLLKLVLLKAATVVGLSLAVRGLGRVAKVLVRFVEYIIEIFIRPHLSPFEEELAIAIAKGKQKAQREAYELYRLYSQWFSKESRIADVVAKSKAAKKQLSSALRQQLTDILTVVLPVPPGSRVKSLAFEVLEDGTVIQTLTTTLNKNVAGRTEPQLRVIAEQLGQVGNPGEHWSHIAANRLEGDDALYNLIRAEARINISLMHDLDRLATGTVVRVRLVFESHEAALARYASSAEYFNVTEGKLITTIEDFFTRPPKTLGQMKREAQDLVARLSSQPIDEKTARLLQQLSEIITLGK